MTEIEQQNLTRYFVQEIESESNLRAANNNMMASFIENGRKAFSSTLMLIVGEDVIRACWRKATEQVLAEKAKTTTIQPRKVIEVAEPTMPRAYNGRAPRRKSWRMLLGKEQQVRDLLAIGYSTTKIGKQFGVDHKSVETFMRKRLRLSFETFRKVSRPIKAVAPTKYTPTLFNN